MKNVMDKIYQQQVNEITEYHFYSELAKTAKDEINKDVLKEITGLGAYLSDDADTIKQLIKVGTTLSTYTNTAEAKGTVEALTNDGVKLEFARDHFLHYKDKQKVVLTFLK